MPATLFKKETLAQVLSHEFCEISYTTTFSYITTQLAVSEYVKAENLVDVIKS